MKTLKILSLMLLISALAFAQAQRGQRPPDDPRDMGGGRCAENPMNCKDAPRPIAGVDSVWIEELTWMDVRDAVKGGKDTVLITTGGVEPNGPYLVTGKHNYVLQANCDAIARKMGNALCAPIIKLVPEGNIDPPSSHMKSPGTISMREETFRMVLEDTARSLRNSTGFKNIVFFGDSGGNQAGMKAVAEKLNAEWRDTTVVFIPEYYTYNAVQEYINTLGLKETAPEHLHDDIGITLNMLVTDPKSVRWDQRVKAGKASINGVSIADQKKAMENGKKIVEFRSTQTVNAIKKALASAKPKTSGF